MDNDTLEFDLETLVQQGQMDTIRERFDQLHPADIAAMINELEAREGWTALALLELAEQAEVFGYLDHDFQVELATVAPRAKLARIVVEMNADERADLYNELSDEQREAWGVGSLK